MRRSDREITDFSDILAVMEGCDVCRLALNDEGHPYIVPLNFGMEVSGGKITLYFHSALEGHKVDLIRKDPRAAFEMDRKHQLQYLAGEGRCTMAYESVMGQGRIRFLKEDEKKAALERLMAHYHPGEKAPFNTAAMSKTLVYALDVDSLTGKRKLPK